MRDDVPAAIPLIALMAGLACGPLLVDPWLATIGLLLTMPRLRSAALFAALGILLSLLVSNVNRKERDAFARLDPERFTVIEAPLEHDWSPRGGAFLIRASRFTANGVEFREPVAIYARFAPPEIAMERTLRAEAFLRMNEHGGYAASIKSAELLRYEGRLAAWQPAAWNRMLANRLEPYAREHPTEVALAHALVLGRGERLDEALRESFRRGGTYHLLVFSGLQITFAALILAAVLRWLHKPRASDWLLLAFALLAPPFIGPTASVSRASIGIALYAVSRILKRPTSIENLWCVAALARLIVEPRDLGEASFHLTYAGAGALLFIGKHLGVKRRWLAAVVGAEAAIVPLTLHHFNQYAVGGSLLTLLMSPLIFAMLAMSALAFAIPCDALFAAIRVLNRLCVTLNVAGMSGYFPQPPMATMLIGFGGALLAIAFLRERRRAIAILIALTIPTTGAIVTFIRERRVEHPRVTFLDVGQGDAIAIRNGSRAILVDGGPQRRILGLLAARGLTRFDAVVLTHAHPDHCEGLIPVIEQMRVGSVWISPRRFRGDCATRLLDACSATQTPIHLIRDGDVLDLDGVRVTTILASRTFRRAKENNSSVVLRVETGGRRMLLTGDIEAEAELDLDDRDLRADVLKVAHHGSRSSTRPAFVEQVNPRLAVVSCGRRNLFGHPHPSVLQTLAARRVRVWRTDRDGSVDVDVEAGRLYVRSRKD